MCPHFFLFFLGPLCVRVCVAPGSCSDVTHVSLPSTGPCNGCAGRSKWHVESLRVSGSSSTTLLCHCPAVTHRSSSGALCFFWVPASFKNFSFFFHFSAATLNVCTKSHFTPCHKYLDPVLCWVDFSGGSSHFLCSYKEVVRRGVCVYLSIFSKSPLWCHLKSLCNLWQKQPTWKCKYLYSVPVLYVFPMLATAQL